MEVYNAPEQDYADAYLIQDSKLTAQYTQNRDHLEVMYSGGAPEFVVDQGIYYPAATNYGYICTGVEPPGDWDDRQMVFGLDGQEVCYPGAESENLPFVYYTPNFAYAQSPYNPYNPYIPGAVVGVDGSIIAPQQYYNVPSYETHSSSPMYFPMLVQSRPETNAHNTSHPFVDTTSSNSNRADGPNLKHNFSPASPAFSATPWLPAAKQTISYTRASDGNDVAGGPSKQSLAKGRTTSSALPFHPASSPIIHGKSAQGLEKNSPLKVLSNRGQSKFGVSNGSGLSNFRPSMHVQNTADKVPSKFPFVKVHNETKVCAEKSREQNLPPTRPKSDISENKLTARAFSSRAGDADKQGNITIHLDQYDKNDVLFNYPNAKFFVIKSYSEDDVHKSIKYKVWSSTPNGNKKLNSAYEDAQRISHATSGSCPIFLFFSVNASGQFCGVAEMTSPVDFHKDMDFWQQDKWSGSFPVKWHLIKDVPNPNFRHILLENNENKPVTNSRDTQEIRYKKGMEMLKIYRDYLSRTSLLDDFLYYDNRQRILQEEKSKLLLKNYNNPFFVPVINPPRKLNGVVDGGGKNGRTKVSTSSSTNSDTIAADSTGIINSSVNTTHEVDDVPKGEPDMEEALDFGSLNITSTQSESAPPEAADGSSSDSASNDVLTVGSIPLKVNGTAGSSGFLTFGTIPLDPKALEDFADGSTKPGTKSG